MTGPGRLTEKPMHNAAKAAVFRRGLVVGLVLTILTAVEFEVSSYEAALVALLSIALMKTAAILQYYMHLGRVWQEDEEHS